MALGQAVENDLVVLVGPLAISSYSLQGLRIVDEAPTNVLSDPDRNIGRLLRD